MLGVQDLVVPLGFAAGDIIPTGTRVDVFQRIFWVFLILGTLVGVVVIGYMLYNAYKYRDREARKELDDPPQLGEVPRGGGKGRKLFLSFALSAIIVISLIVWTYGTLLFVEDETIASAQPSVEEYQPSDEQITVHVEGYQFGWRYTYPNGVTLESTADEPLRVPRGKKVNLIVSSADVMHNFWIPEQRVKTDAIPGQNTTTWFEGSETGQYRIVCAELCGAGHSYMNGQTQVMTQSEFDQWYANATDQ
jgi:cytochrome c oxidase subunit 2